MIVVSFETEKDQKEILDKAVKYFVDNIGLKMTKRNDCCVYFEGEDQLGYVKVTLSQKGKKFEVECRSHRIVVDQKKSDDGTDEGMNPVELFNAALASCNSKYWENIVWGLYEKELKYV